MNFQTTQEEITLIVNPEKIVLKNYVDDEPGTCFIPWGLSVSASALHHKVAQRTIKYCILNKLFKLS